MFNKMTQVHRDKNSIVKKMDSVKPHVNLAKQHAMLCLNLSINYKPKTLEHITKCKVNGFLFPHIQNLLANDKFKLTMFSKRKIHNNTYQEC